MTWISNISHPFSSKWSKPENPPSPQHKVHCSSDYFKDSEIPTHPGDLVFWQSAVILFRSFLTVWSPIWRMRRKTSLLCNKIGSKYLEGNKWIEKIKHGFGNLIEATKIFLLQLKILWWFWHHPKLITLWKNFKNIMSIVLPVLLRNIYLIICNI